MVPPFVIRALVLSPVAPPLGVIAIPITPTAVRSTRIHRINIAAFVMTLARWRMVRRYARMGAAPSGRVILAMRIVIQIRWTVVKSTSLPTSITATPVEMLVALQMEVPLAQIVRAPSRVVTRAMMTVIRSTPMAVRPTSITASIPAAPARFSVRSPTVRRCATPEPALSPVALHRGTIVIPTTRTVVKATRIHRICIADFVMTLAQLRMARRFARMGAAPSVLVILGMRTVTQIRRTAVRST